MQPLNNDGRLHSHILNACGTRSALYLGSPSHTTTPPHFALAARSRALLDASTTGVDVAIHATRNASSASMMRHRRSLSSSISLVTVTVFTVVLVYLAAPATRGADGATYTCNARPARAVARRTCHAFSYPSNQLRPCVFGSLHHARACSSVRPVRTVRFRPCMRYRTML